MQRDDLEARLAEYTPSEVPDDVEQRYKELQAEMQQLDLASTTIAGESREERYQRQRRLRALHREFDQMSRTPMSRRMRANSTMVGAIAGVCLLLCVVSFVGGALLTGVLNKPPDMANVGTQFWTYLEQQQYNTAHGYVDPNLDSPGQFTQDATSVDQTLGKVTGFIVVSTNGGSPTAPTNSIVYRIHRSGATSSDANGNRVTNAASDYIITLSFTYIAASNSWTITDFGKLLTTQAQATPTS